MGKHFTADVREDGFHVVRTSLPESVMAAGGTVRACRSLSRAGRAFRTMGTVDLKVHPVHHRLAGRVRAHVLPCMLAHYVEWHMREALKPLPFHDGAPVLAASPAAPAEPSDGAAPGAAGKRPASGPPAQGFQGLTAHVLLCMLALHVEWRMRRRPTPMLFEDDGREGTRTRRGSPVERAETSAGGGG